MFKEINIEDRSDFGNNEKYINSIRDWFSNFKRNDKSSICIKGPIGCGKTEIINYLCRKNNLKIRKIDFDNLNNKIKSSKKENKEIELYLKNLVNSIDIDDILAGRKSKNIIVINKNEMYNFSKNKQQIINILKCNNKLKISPIIMIYDNSYNKEYENIEKEAEVYYLEKPDNNTIKNYINKFCKKNNILIQNNLINKFINDTPHNFNKIKISFNNFLVLYKNKIKNKEIIDLNDYNEYKKINNEEEITYNIYTTTEELLTKYKNLNYANKLFSYEKVIIPIMIQQFIDKSFIMNLDINLTDDNLPLYYNNDKNKKIMNYYKKVLNNISFGNMFDNYIYNEQKWKLINYYCYFSTSSISYYVNKINNNKIKIEVSPYNYPKDLNKTSNMKLNYVHIRTMYNHFNILLVENYLYIINIIIELCKNKDINKIRNFCKYYKLSFLDLENIFKINKLKNLNDKNNKILTNNIKNIIDFKDKNKIIKK